MGVREMPGTVVLCCSLPEDLEPREAAARLDTVSAVDVPVTWLVAADLLATTIERNQTARGPRGVAVDMPGGCQPSGLRRGVAEARRLAADLDAVVVRGGDRLETARLLAECGVHVVYRDAAVPPAKSGRRPAPPGWRCHSPAWGLWEVWRDESPLPPGGWLRTWGRGTAFRRGGLAVVDLAAGAPGGRAAATIRSRVDRWKAWAGRPSSGSAGTFALLSAVPALVAAADGTPAGGSVLRAA